MKLGQKDFLLLAFNDAKLSLLEYSPELNTLNTISIHYYEKEELKREALLIKPDPLIRTDPQNRVACLKFFSDKLAILPFKDFSMDTELSKPFLPSFVMSFAQIHSSIVNVSDFVFLNDFFEPTLAILYDTQPTWTGYLSSRKDNKSLMVVSLSLSTKTTSILYRVDNLPYNCHQLLPVPSPTGNARILFNYLNRRCRYFFTKRYYSC